MNEIRIQELASAVGQMEHFDEFEFIVDVPQAEASMKIRGKELQERVAPKAHTHPIAQVQGLQSALDEKLNRSGGSIQGDFSVEGNAYMRNLRLEEFLDVPEFRYNRVETTVGDKWSAPGAGVVLAVDKDHCRLNLKLEPGEVASLRRDDLCMGIFKSSTVGNFTEPTEDSDDSKGIRTFAGFTTCYFRLVECLDEQTFGEWRYELREGFAYHPTEMMNIVAIGNATDTSRQASHYTTRTYDRYLVGMNTWTIGVENIAAQFGDLVNLAAHGLDMRGYSAYLKNVYLQGYISDVLGDNWFDSRTGDVQLYNRTSGCGISFKGGVLRFGRIDPLRPEEGTDLDALQAELDSARDTLAKINSDEVVSPIEKSFLKERLHDIRSEYEQLLLDADTYLVREYRRVTATAGRIANSQLRIIRKKDAAWDDYVNAYILAVTAIEKYTRSTPEYITIEPDFQDIAAYYEARAIIVKTIRAASEEQGQQSDLEYLRDNFRDVTTEIDGQSGVVLSGFVGVKDENNARVVAGMAGSAISGTVDEKHGKLMLFAGADGIQNAGTAKTRIYEDGHIEMATGVFSGHIRFPFKTLREEGTRYNTATRKYTVDRNMNLQTIGEQYQDYKIWINLPTSNEYIGNVLTLYDTPVRTRSSPDIILAVDDAESGILSSIKQNDFGFDRMQRVKCYAGILQLVAVPGIYAGKCWWLVTYLQMCCFEEYTE